MADSIIAKVFRFNPAVDAEPYYSIYEVPWIEDPTNKMTVLQVLQYINEEIEPVNYDYACVSGLCGRCSIMVDGVPALACWACIEPGEHTFEPLKGMPVVRDLKVDKHQLYERYVDVNLANQTVNPIHHIKDIDYDLYWNTLEHMNMCRECMCCYAGCPSLQTLGNWEKYAGPGAMVGIAHRFLDPHDESDRVAQAAFAGVFKCIQCGNCTSVCPAAIDVAGAIKTLQDAAEERGMKPDNA